MQRHHSVSEEPQPGWSTRVLGRPAGWAITLALAALGLYLFITHAGHTVAALPYLLLLACPLMHLFGHGGHGHRHREGDDV